MKFKVGDTTYTHIRKNSPAWYSLIALKILALLAESFLIIFIAWALISFTILVLG